MKVVTLPALSDNYIFLLVDEEHPRAAVVDPGEARPVLAALDGEGRALESVLCTHHHGDHVGGVAALLRRWPGAPVYASAGDRGRVPVATTGVDDGATLTVCGREARVLAVPGHTRGHVAYFFPAADGSGDLFSGDTVFGGTVGNLFEGTPAVMLASVAALRALPPRTRIWCAHEYTLQYVREATRLDPGNRRLAARLAALEAADPRAPTVPLLLEEERATNPFFRYDDEDLARHLGTAPGLPTFQKLCDLT